MRRTCWKLRLREFQFGPRADFYCFQKAPCCYPQRFDTQRRRPLSGAPGAIMKKCAFLLSIAILLSLSATAFAGGGMWLYERFPSAKVKQMYGWAPDQAWLDHVRLSSVRMGASASFVSPDGLVFTNHHVGAGCVHDISTAQHDYMKEGFYAGPAGNEPKCPGLQVSVLTDIKD